MLQPSDNAANLGIEEEKKRENSSEKLSNEEIAEIKSRKKFSAFEPFFLVNKTYNNKKAIGEKSTIGSDKSLKMRKINGEAMPRFFFSCCCWIDKTRFFVILIRDAYIADVFLLRDIQMIRSMLIF